MRGNKQIIFHKDVEGNEVKSSYVTRRGEMFISFSQRVANRVAFIKLVLELLFLIDLLFVIS